MVRTLEGEISELLTMLIADAIQGQTLVPTTLSQVEYKTRTQSWLGLTPSHLMTGKCSILLDLSHQHNCLLIVSISARTLTE